MRSAKVQDYWGKVYKRKYTDFFLEINMNSLNNLPKINFSNGIMAICGLNGAGKSTILSAIKDIVGLPLSEKDSHKLAGKEIQGKAIINGEEVNCSNNESNRLIDNGLSIDRVIYLDFETSVNIQDHLAHQTNLNELLEQYEEYEFAKNELDDINYLTGKKYDFCSIKEIDSIDNEGTIYPYFYVKVENNGYNTIGMGTGEHFLIYLFWCINRAKKDDIIIIEEPESFVSISSQEHFSNYLAKQMCEKGIKVLLTTHSPYILRNIKNENIRIISRFGNEVSIQIPDKNVTVESILGLESKKLGTFFVEDRVARDWLFVILQDQAPYLLKQYTIDIAGGDANISSRLNFPKNENIKYNFVGIYDGDVREAIKLSESCWPHCFLPEDTRLEDAIRKKLRVPANLEEFCKCVNRDKSEIVAFLAQHEGADGHDWFDELRKNLSMDGNMLISAAYHSLFKESESVKQFIEDLLNCIE